MAYWDVKNIILCIISLMLLLKEARQIRNWRPNGQWETEPRWGMFRKYCYTLTHKRISLNHISGGAHFSTWLLALDSFSFSAFSYPPLNSVALYTFSYFWATG